MKVNSISWKEAIGICRQSFRLGKNNYPLFFLCSLALSVFSALSELHLRATVIYSILFIFLVPGPILISQKIVLGTEEPTIKDLFVAFKSHSLMKRLVPSVIANIALLCVVGIFMIVLSLIFSQWILPSLKLDSSSSVQFLIFGSWGLFSAIFIFASVFFTYFSILLATTRSQWRILIKASVKCGFKNLLKLLLPMIPVFFVATVGAVLSITIGVNKENSLFVDALSLLFLIVQTVVGPFFLTYQYLLMKKIFVIVGPEVIVSEF